MSELYNLWAQAASLFSNLLIQPDWRNFLDIAIVAIIVYQIMRMFMHTRADSVIKGVGIVILFTWISDILQLNAINWLLLQILNTGALLLVVLFQPEIRRGLDSIGRKSWWARMFGNKVNQNAEKCIDELARAMMDLSHRRVGALVVIERETGLSDVLASGTAIDALISAPLIENIFEPNTPLHDGAMIIIGERIAAAACILQLTENTSISRDLGTRHRAGIGISETTDAIVLIVSEETGTISTARDGKLTRFLDKKSLTDLLTAIFMPQQDSLWKKLLKRKEARHEGKV